MIVGQGIDAIPQYNGIAVEISNVKGLGKQGRLRLTPVDAL